MKIPVKTVEAFPDAGVHTEVRGVTLLRRHGSIHILFELEDPETGRKWTWLAEEGQLDEVFVP